MRLCVCLSAKLVSACYTILADSPLAHGGSTPHVAERQRPSCKLGSHFFVHFNVKRPSLNLPCHKSRVKAISDTFSSLSSSCVCSEYFSPDCGIFRNVWCLENNFLHFHLHPTRMRRVTFWNVRHSACAMSGISYLLPQTWWIVRM